MNKYADQSKASKARKSLYGRIHRKGTITCIKKRAHSSDKAAKKWLDDNGYAGSPYRCPNCHKWHVSTKRQEEI